MKKQIQSKHIPALTLVLAAAEQRRASDRGDGFDGWPDVPPKVLRAKLNRLADRGVFFDWRGTLNTTHDWTLPDAEKAEILAAMDAAGHRFDAHGWLVSRAEDVAEGKRRAKEAAAERQRLRTCKPATVADLLGKLSVLTADACVEGFERYVMTGRVDNG